MMNSILFGILIVTALNLVPEFAQAGLSGVTPTCGSGRSGWTTYKWCVYKDSTVRSSTVLYYFHGNAGSERSWGSADHNQLSQKWGTGTDAPAAVITISFGSNWFLNDKLQKIVTDSAMPAAEAQLNFSVRTRVLLGESMGGFNASVMAQQSRPVFDRIAIVCPAIYNINPYAHGSDVRAFINNQPEGINTSFIHKWLGKQRDYYSSGEEFNAIDPTQWTERISDRRFPLYLQANQNDPLGVHDGALLMAKAARARKLNIQWTSLPNTGHCQQTQASMQALARFISSKSQLLLSQVSN